MRFWFYDQYIHALASNKLTDRVERALDDMNEQLNRDRALADALSQMAVAIGTLQETTWSNLSTSNPGTSTARNPVTYMQHKVSREYVNTVDHYKVSDKGLLSAAMSGDVTLWEWKSTKPQVTGVRAFLYRNNELEVSLHVVSKLRVVVPLQIYAGFMRKGSSYTINSCIIDVISAANEIDGVTYTPTIVQSASLVGDINEGGFVKWTSDDTDMLGIVVEVDLSGSSFTMSIELPGAEGPTKHTKTYTGGLWCGGLRHNTAVQGTMNYFGTPVDVVDVSRFVHINRDLYDLEVFGVAHQNIKTAYIDIVRTGTGVTHDELLSILGNTVTVVAGIAFPASFLPLMLATSFGDALTSAYADGVTHSSMTRIIETGMQFGAMLKLSLRMPDLPALKRKGLADRYIQLGERLATYATDGVMPDNSYKVWRGYQSTGQLPGPIGEFGQRSLAGEFPDWWKRNSLAPGHSSVWVETPDGVIQYETGPGTNGRKGEMKRGGTYHKDFLQFYQGTGESLLQLGSLPESGEIRELMTESAKDWNLSKGYFPAEGLQSRDVSKAYDNVTKYHRTVYRGATALEVKSVDSMVQAMKYADPPYNILAVGDSMNCHVQADNLADFIVDGKSDFLTDKHLEEFVTALSERYDFDEYHD
jgi:hypothetical protein